jgi:hypothetical protein
MMPVTSRGGRSRGNAFRFMAFGPGRDNRLMTLNDAAATQAGLNVAAPWAGYGTGSRRERGR